MEIVEETPPAPPAKDPSKLAFRTKKAIMSWVTALRGLWYFFIMWLFFFLLLEAWKFISTNEWKDFQAAQTAGCAVLMLMVWERIWIKVTHKL